MTFAQHDVGSLSLAAERTLAVNPGPENISLIKYLLFIVFHKKLNK